MDCRFEDCDFSTAMLFGASVFTTSLAGCEFGDASFVNALGVAHEDVVERLYDNDDIRLWLKSSGAQVNVDNLVMVRQEPPTAEEMIAHVSRKFFPRGSDAEQRHKLRTTFATSLPDHRRSDAEDLVSWLEADEVLVPGPLLRGRQTLALSDHWRDHFREWMRANHMSEQLRDLITRASGR